MSNKMSIKEYKNEINRIHSPRGARAVRKNNTKTKVHKPSIQKVSRLQKLGSDALYDGPFRIEVEIYGKCRADIDNVLKGYLDALNGIAFKDDRQCVDARVMRKS